MLAISTTIKLDPLDRWVVWPVSLHGCLCYPRRHDAHPWNPRDPLSTQGKLSVHALNGMTWQYRYHINHKYYVSKKLCRVGWSCIFCIWGRYRICCSFQSGLCQAGWYKLVMYDHAIIEFLDRMVKEYQKIEVWWKWKEQSNIKQL